MSFTDIDRSGLVGVSLKGTAWQRADDTVGVAGVVNALSSVHARFLEAGGLGVLVGDGKLSYGTEDILEAYYRFQVVKPLSLTADYQFVANPAYNRDRGPVSIFALRAHLQF
jgi:high affinity Mn2+ porin